MYKLYRNVNGRLYMTDKKPHLKGIYNNDPHTLIRFDTGMDEQTEEQYTLVLAQIKKRRDTYYTISVYSSLHPFRFRVCEDIPPYKVCIYICVCEDIPPYKVCIYV